MDIGKEKIIFYIDVNNAFLSWTAVDLLKSGYKTDIRTIPSIIGGDEESRHGIVLAKSPVAKKLGIVTGEPIYQARKKCPNLKVYPMNYKIYIKYSNALYEIYKEYTDKVARFSIDECLLDMTGCIMKNENPITLAEEIKEKIKNTYGFTVNIGIAHNKILSKMASDMEKPDKVHTLLNNQQIEEKMWKLPVEELFMVGRKSVPKLKMLGIKTIGDLAKYDKKILISKFGKHGKLMYEYANGIDSEEINFNYGKPKGIGNSTTLKQDYNDINKLNKILLELTEQTTYRLRKQNMLAKTVNVQIKTKDFQTYSHQGKLDKPTASTKLIYEKAKKLLSELYKGEYVRLIGIRVDNLVDTEEMQISIFDNSTNEKMEKLDKVLDNLKEKYGDKKIQRASKMK